MGEERTKPEQTKRASDQIQMRHIFVKLSNREYKINITNILKALMGNIDNIQEQMSNVTFKNFSCIYTIVSLLILVKTLYKFMH